MQQLRDLKTTLERRLHTATPEEKPKLLAALAKVDERILKQWDKYERAFC